MTTESLAAPFKNGLKYLGLVEYLQIQGFSLLARLSLLYVLFKPIGSKWERMPLLVLAGWGIIAEGVTRRFWFWIAVLALTVTQMSWQSDNHIYLFAYWLLTLAIATLWSDPEAICRINGRLLIGGAMALAFAWKAILSPDYLDGTFFHTIFFLDPRLKDFARLAGGMTDELYNYNRFLLRSVNGGDFVWPVFLKSTPQMWSLALFSTWWTVLVEGAIAVLFLVPLRYRITRYREWALVTFTASTYAVAPVAGFGWLLMILGLAQCEPEKRAARVALLASFVLVLAYSTSSIAKTIAETVQWGEGDPAPAAAADPGAGIVIPKPAELSAPSTP